MSRHPDHPTLPGLDEFREPGETLIRFEDDGPDRQGRRTFFAFWEDHNVGPRMDEHGVRGQIFVTDPERFVARHRPVRVIEEPT